MYAIRSYYAEGFHQGGQVLALVGAGDGQHHGLAGVAQEAGDFRRQRGVRLVPGGGMKTGEIDAGRNHQHALGVVAIVEFVLLGDFVRNNFV